MVSFASLLLLPVLVQTASAGEGRNGWHAFSALQNGNMRFYEGRLTHQNQNPQRREEVANAQNPHTIVISCSDSHVGPEIIFDQGLGDLFTVRVAGNVMNAEAIASVEYAIAQLGARLLVVMGHESCGAVKMAVNARPGSSNGSESLDTLVEHIRAHIPATTMMESAADSSLRQPVKAHVAATMKELLRKSDIVVEAVRKKGLILAQGIYAPKTGRVEFWDVGTKSEIVAASASGAPADAPQIPEHKIQEEIIPAVAPEEKKKAKATAH